MKLNEIIKLLLLLLFSKLLFFIMQKKLDLVKTPEVEIFSLIFKASIEYLFKSVSKKYHILHSSCVHGTQMQILKSANMFVFT